MKTTIHTGFLRSRIWLFAFLFIAGGAMGQTVRPDFTSPAFEKAIGQIVKDTDGKYTKEEIYQQLVNPGENLTDIVLSPDADPTFTVTPYITFVEFHGGDDAVFNYNITFSAPYDDYIIYEVEQVAPNGDWVEVANFTVNKSTKKIFIPVDMNTATQARYQQIRIWIKFEDTASPPPDPPIADVLLNSENYVLQGPAPASQFIYLSPKYQLVSYDGTENAVFNYYAYPVVPDNAADFSFVYNPTDPPGDWIDSPTINIANQTITFPINENTSTTSNSTTITVSAVINDAGETAEDVVDIVQEGSPNAFLYVSPNYLFVDYTGGWTDIATITEFNTGGWNVDTLTLPSWLDGVDSSHVDNTIKFNVKPRVVEDAGQATIQLRAVNDLSVTTSILLYQSGAPDSALIASPREAIVLPEGKENLAFDVTSINLGTGQTWKLDEASLPADGWITKLAVTNTKLRLKVKKNETGETRMDSVFIEALANPDIRDKVFIYQYATSDTFLIASPRDMILDSKRHPSETFNVLRYNVPVDGWETEVTQNGNWLEVLDEGDDVLEFKVTKNNTQARTAKIKLFSLNSLNDTSAKDLVYVYQYGYQAPEIHAEPTINYLGSEDTSLSVSVYSNYPWLFDVIENTDGVIANTIKTGSGLDFSININQSDNTKYAKVVVYSEEDNAVTDTIKITQASSYILLNPREKLVKCEGENFPVEIDLYGVNPAELMVYSENTAIASATISGTSLYVTVTPNPDETSRTTYLVVYQASNPDINDTLKIFQFSCSEPYLLLHPREQFAKWGDTQTPIPFVITSHLVENVSVATDNPSWVTPTIVGNNVDVTLTVNSDPLSRFAKIWVHQTGSTEPADTVFVYQGAAPQPYLLASPRERNVLHTGSDNVSFAIERVNIPMGGWQVDNATVQTSWITVLEEGGDILKFDVAQNDGYSTRSDTIFFYDSSDPDVYDSVFIYQYSALDTFLLAEPRERQVSYEGSTNVDFTVTSVNLPGGWEVDPTTVQQAWIPSWIIQDSLLRFTVDENLTLKTRKDTIRIFGTGFPTVEDYISIYQFSRPEYYLFASPREQNVPHYGNDSVEFRIVSVNVSDWVFDASTVPEWVIGAFNQGDTVMRLNVAPNDTLTTRQATIRYFATTPNDSIVEDSVTIYQYSALDSYIIGAPREAQLDWEQDTALFHVTTVNVDSVWFVDTTTLKDWILAANINYADSSLTIVAKTNPLFEVRRDTIGIYATAGDTTVRDSIVVYQSSRPEYYLYASPREQSVSHDGSDSVGFAITMVNIDHWSFDKFSIPSWVSDTINIGDSIMQLVVDQNTSLETRFDTIYYFATVNDSIVYDSVWIFQAAAPDTFLLVQPREVRVSYEGTGNDSATFIITQVNLPNGWNVDTSSVDLDWITFDNVADTLKFWVAPNDLLFTRLDHIRLEATGYPNIEDSLTIYQYSSVDQYILMSPREQTVPYAGLSPLDFLFKRVNVGPVVWDIDWIKGPPGWIVNVDTIPGNPSDNPEDTLRMDVLMNLSFDTVRLAKITLTSVSNDTVKDSVYVYQFPHPDSSIVVSPRERVLSHHAHPEVDFEVTSINIGENGWTVGNVGNWIQWTGPDPDDSNLLRLSVEENTTHKTRDTTVYVYAVDDAAIFDTVRVFQYSGFDTYILLSPRDTLVPYTGSDSVGFKVTSVNIGPDGWDYEYITPNSWVHELSMTNDYLAFWADANSLKNPRQVKIRVFDKLNTSVADTVTITQNAPYFILVPSAIDSITSDSTTVRVKIYSNIENYTITPEEGVNPVWYYPNKYSGSLNDSIFLTVLENESSYQSRSSYLRITYPVDTTISKDFYFQQSKAPDDSIAIKGYLLVDDDPSKPLIDYKIYIGDDSTFTDNSGFYVDSVLVGWFGTVRPEIVNYYFLPASRDFGTISTDTTANFKATLIQPVIVFSQTEVTGCQGDSIYPGQAEYPKATITGIYGETKYVWTSNPLLEGVISNRFIKEPTFYTDVIPEGVDEIEFILTVICETTIEISGSNSFTMTVRENPKAKDFIGEWEVCYNQAGVIYEVDADQFPYGESFSWTLSSGGDFLGGAKTNIVTIDWGSQPGQYTLSLETLSEYGCAENPVTHIVTVNNNPAPPKTDILWKQPDNMLLCDNWEASDYTWGYYTTTNSQLDEKVIFENKNDWYCRLPDGHKFDPVTNKYFVELTYAQNSCVSTSFYNNNVPVSVDENEAQSISVYPNPTTGEFRIRFENSEKLHNANLNLLDLSGQVVVDKKLSNIRNNSVITIKETELLQPGIYLIRITSDNYLYTTKIVVR